ncbi:MAG: DNA repair protein RadC [Bacteroidota bacterium]
MEKLYTQQHIPISDWAEEDRPREKLRDRGKQSLSDSELLAILLRSGSREESAVALAQRLLKKVNNNLFELGRCTFSELKQHRGMGEAKALTVLAAMELGRRRQLCNAEKRKQIRSSSDAYKVMSPLLADLKHEEFWVILLNRSNRIIGKEQVSTGGIASTVVDAKMVYQRSVIELATSIVLCHNHPSGNLRPSKADIDLTQKLVRGGAALDITILDHLIISELGYYSFADEGML